MQRTRSIVDHLRKQNPDEIAEVIALMNAAVNEIERLKDEIKRLNNELNRPTPVDWFTRRRYRK